MKLAHLTEAAPVVEPFNLVGEFGDEALKVVLSLQNEIREIKGKPALKDVEEIRKAS